MTITSLRRQPTQARSRARVDTILDAAADLLAEVGSSGTTITTVSERIGLAPGSIYEYVESDRKLIGAVAQRGLDALHAELVQIFGRPSGRSEAIDALDRALNLFLDRYHSAPGLRHALAFVDADPELALINLDDSRRNAAVIEAALVAALTDAATAPGQVPDFSVTALLLTHFTGSLAALTRLVDDDEAHELVEAYRRLVTSLVTNPR